MLRRLCTLAAACATTLVASGAALPAAAAPTTLELHGMLSSAAGVIAPDGAYVLNLALYKDATGGTALWTEGPLLAVVKNGQFHIALGEKAALTAELMGKFGAAAWLGVKVEPDDELPRVPLRAVAFALRATTAAALDCSGCVGVGHLDPQVLAPFAKTADLGVYAKAADLDAYAKSVDLQPYAKSADLQAYAKAADLGAYAKTADLGVFAKAADLAAYAKAADLQAYAKATDLTGLAKTSDLADYVKAASLAKVAGSGAYGDLAGLPVLAKTGTSCGSGLVLKGIKADGSYDCVAGFDPANLPKDALDEVSNGLLTNQFNEVAASTKTPLDIPDGLPAGVSDAIDVPDFGTAQGLKISVKLSNSDISKIRVTVYDPSGAAYKLYDQGGTGTSLDGTWPAPNNVVQGDLTAWNGKNPKGLWSINIADLVGSTGKPDGKLLSWSVQVATLSGKKAAATAGFQLAQLTSAPVPCNASNAGTMWFNTKDSTLQVCNGSQYFPLSLAYPGTVGNPAVTCKDLLAKLPATASGTYWIDPDGQGGLGAFQVYCDMGTQGGGWTRIDETTDYTYKIYTEGVGEQPYTYVLSDAHIDAIKAKSTEGRQAWQCHTVGVGSAYDLRWWPKQLTDTYSGCWDPGNSAEKTASGVETNFSNLPQRAWLSEDCGDPSEACQHNVDHAWLR
ncbi:MAG: hypothetical protein HY902_07550 [Deltaproteobacteria bacterium]|nr:hypothetical protein [Deltaproteobacteria bacterium]